MTASKVSLALGGEKRQPSVATREGKTTRRSRSPVRHQRLDSDSSGGSHGSTTLRSVLEKISLTMFAEEERQVSAGDDAAEDQVRKTPFGVIRVPSGGSTAPIARKPETPAVKASKVAMTRTIKPNSVRGEGSLLPAVRQRTRQGRIELREDGTLHFCMHSSDLAIIIAPDGNQASLLKGNDTLSSGPIAKLPSSGLDLHHHAVAWLRRYRRRVVVASFRTSVTALGVSAVCSIRANGQQPDHELHIPARRRQNAANWAADMAIHVSRQRRSMTISVAMGEQNKRQPWSWRLIQIPIASVSSADGEQTTWHIHLSQSSAQDLTLLHHLSRAERRAVLHALSLTSDVDAVAAVVSRSTLPHSVAS